MKCSDSQSNTDGVNSNKSSTVCINYNDLKKKKEQYQNGIRLFFSILGWCDV